MIDLVIHPASPTSPQIDDVVNALRLEGFRAGRQSVTGTLGNHAVLYFWTEDNLTQTTSFDAVTESVAVAKRLVSVRLAGGELPKGLPDHPIVDLSGWRGEVTNERFQDVVAMLRAADMQEAPPRPRPRWRRLFWKACGGLTATAVILFLISIPIRILELQNNLCSVAWPQPSVSDFCGGWGLGGKPKKEERIAWETREPGSCEGLRSHIERFPDGVFFGRASASLDARRIEIDETWEPEAIRDIFSQSFAPDGKATVDAAQEQALASGHRWAEESCRAYAATDFFRFVSVELEVSEWDCLSQRSGHYCGFEGYRTCHLEELQRTELESCGVAQ